MQDNYQNIDKEFTDHAWGEMQKLLDAEMPLPSPPPKKKKRFLWLWFLLGLVLSTALGYGSFTYFQTPPKATVEEVGLPIAKTEQKESKAELLEDEHTLSILAVTEKEQDKKASTNLRSDKTTLKKEGVVKTKTNKLSSTTNPNAVSKNQEARILQNSKEVISENLEVEKSVKNNDFLSDKINHEEELALVENDGLNSIKQVDNQDITIEETRLGTINSKLAILPIQKLQYEKEEAPLTFIPAQTKTFWQKINPASFAISASILNNPFQNINGFSGGLVANYPLLNPSFGFSLGAEYALVHHDFEKDNPSVALPLEDANIPNSAFDPSKHFSAHERSTFSGTMNLHYLQLPINFHYQPYAKFQIHTGVVPSILLAGPAFSTGGFLDSQTSEKDFLAISAGDNSESNLLELEKFDMAAIAGIQYQVLPNLGVNLQYQLGMVDFFQQNQKGQFNRFLKIGMVLGLK